MALKSHSLLAIFALLVALFGVAAAKEEGFVAADPKDPKVLEVAKFAIDEYDKEHNANLTLSGVFQAAYAKTAQGARYALVVEANDGTGVNQYYAYVLVKQDAKQLVAFKKKIRN